MISVSGSLVSVEMCVLQRERERERERDALVRDSQLIHSQCHVLFGTPDVLFDRVQLLALRLHQHRQVNNEVVELLDVLLQLDDLVVLRLHVREHRRLPGMSLTFQHLGEDLLTVALRDLLQLLCTQWWQEDSLGV